MRFSANRRSDCTRTTAHLGFSLIELLIVVAIILIIAAIAVPNLLQSKKAANQSSAISVLRTITTASVSYWVTYSNGYPPSLAAMGGSTGAATCNLSILMDETVTSPPYQKSGYQFAFTGMEGNVITSPTGCTPGFQGYLATATPTSLGITGNSSYCVDEAGILHQNTTGALIATSAVCDALPAIQ
jgi:type IV pilus assembly protein PilA